MRYPRLALGVVAVLAVGALTAGVRILARTERRADEADGVPHNPQSVTNNEGFPSWLAIPRPSGRLREMGQPVPSKRPQAAYRSALIRDVPHVRQKPDFCGEACAAMVLDRSASRSTRTRSSTSPASTRCEARGCYTRELAAALTRIGFQTGPVWYKIPAAKRREQLEAQWKALHADLVAGVPSIVCMHYDDQPDDHRAFPPRPRLRRHEPTR